MVTTGIFHVIPRIGKIVGDQIVKPMTLGLTEEEAEAEILDDFLS